MKTRIFCALVVAVQTWVSAQTPPSITTQSSSQTPAFGANLTLSVTAAGDSPLSYQWNQNGANIPGATNSSYNIPFFQVPDIGSYVVSVTNGYGSASSTNIVLSVSCAPVDAGLKAWWQGEGNTTDYAGGFDGTAHNNTYAFGEVGQCFHFDATASSYVALGTSVGNFSTNDFSVEFWENVPTGNTNQCFIGNHPVSSSWKFWQVGFGSYVAPTNLYFRLGDDTTGHPILSATNIIIDGSWHHIACTRSNIGGSQAVMSIYIDGALATNMTIGVINPNQTTYGLKLGYDQDLARFLTGSMDEVALYSRALSSNEVAAIYAAGAAGKCCADPTIATQPTSPQKMQSTSNAVFKVIAGNGTSPFFYQWSHNSIPLSDGATGSGSTIAGASSASMTVIHTLTANDSGTYSVAVWNACNSAQSQNVYLDLAPKITQHPSNTTASITGTAYFTNVTSGTSLQYIWRYNGSALTDPSKYAGLNTSLLTVLNVQGSDAGSYSVIVTNHGGTATSANGVLSTPPQIAGPMDQTNACSTTATFTATVTGTGGFTYQWQSNTVANPTFSNISGQTGTTLSVANIDSTFSTNGYRVVVNNSVGTTTSATAHLYVKPTVSVAPLVLICSGSSATNCATSCTSDVTYQWLLNGSAISGATTACYTTSTAGTYTVVLANNWGTATSANSVVQNAIDPVITLNPQSQTVSLGNPALLQGNATGQLLQFTWIKDGTYIVGTGTKYLIPSAVATNAGSYVMQAGNSCIFENSSTATLAVNAPTCASNLISTNLIGWWPFENNLHDYNGNYNGTSYGTGVTFPAGKVNLGIHLDGTANSTVDLGAFTNVGTSDFTVEFWIQTTSTDASRRDEILSKRGFCDDQHSFFDIQLQTNGVICFNLEGTNRSTQYNDFSSAASVNDGAFHHVACVRQGVNASIYIDGVLSGTQACSAVAFVSNTYDLQFNNGPCAVSGGYGRFNGTIDELAIYNRALSAAEILSIFNASYDGKCYSCATNLVDSSLAAWWQFESNALDYTSNYNGTASGVTYPVGEVNLGLYFDGTTTPTNYFGTNIGNFGTNDFSVEFWIQTTNSNPMGIMEKRVDCNADYQGWEIHMGYDPNNTLAPGQVGFGIIAGGYTNYGAMGTVINDALWHHVALVRSNVFASMYVDGIMQTNITMPYVIGVSNSTPYKIGRSLCEGFYPGVQPFQGTLDEVSIYNRALSSNEVWSIYQARGTGKCTGP